MRFIENLFIKSFRGIKNLELNDLGDINIFVGKNNSGKTSVLEAIGILQYPLEIGNIIKIGRSREIFNNKSSAYTIFTSMFNKNLKNIEIKANVKNKSFEISIKGNEFSILTENVYSEIKEFEGQILVKHDNSIFEKNIKLNQNDKDFKIIGDFKLIPIEYVTPAEHLLKNVSNEIIKKGKKKELINLLKIFDKDVISLEMIEEQKKIVPYIEHKKLGLMPLSTYGDGLKKVLLLGSSIIKAENGVLLIDEVETAIHIDALVEVFKWFVKACNKYKVQVFMTTHSIEIIDSILESQKDLDNTSFLKDSLRIITIKNSTEGEKTKARILNGLEAYDSRIDFGMELR